jgi:hypothetical protein
MLQVCFFNILSSLLPYVFYPPVSRRVNLNICSYSNIIMDTDHCLRCAWCVSFNETGQGFFWVKEYTPLKIIPRSIEPGIPLTHQQMGPLHNSLGCCWNHNTTVAMIPLSNLNMPAGFVWMTQIYDIWEVACTLIISWSVIITLTYFLLVLKSSADRMFWMIGMSANDVLYIK